jgi:hypothetical protein
MRAAARLPLSQRLLHGFVWLLLLDTDLRHESVRRRGQRRDFEHPPELRLGVPGLALGRYARRRIFPERVFGRILDQTGLQLLCPCGEQRRISLSPQNWVASSALVCLSPV